VKLANLALASRHRRAVREGKWVTHELYEWGQRKRSVESLGDAQYHDPALKNSRGLPRSPC